MGYGFPGGCVGSSSHCPNNIGNNRWQWYLLRVYQAPDGFPRCRSSIPNRFPWKFFVMAISLHPPIQHYVHRFADLLRAYLMMLHIHLCVVLSLLSPRATVCFTHNLFTRAFTRCILQCSSTMRFAWLIQYRSITKTAWQTLCCKQVGKPTSTFRWCCFRLYKVYCLSKLNFSFSRAREEKVRIHVLACSEQ